MSQVFGVGRDISRQLSLNTIKGKVIAYPTEAVWGLGCLADDYQAVMKLLRLKQRPWQKGLILVSGHLKHFEPYLGSLSARQMAVLMSAWPGPHTFLIPLPEPEAVPAWLRGQNQQLALRLSSHPVIKSITGVLDRPIVSTSANPSGCLPALSGRQVRHYFGKRIDYLINGRTGDLKKPTSIVNLVDQTIIRG